MQKKESISLLFSDRLESVRIQLSLQQQCRYSNTRNSMQYFAINFKGKKSEKEYICVHLCVCN